MSSNNTYLPTVQLPIGGYLQFTDAEYQALIAQGVCMPKALYQLTDGPNAGFWAGSNDPLVPDTRLTTGSPADVAGLQAQIDALTAEIATLSSNLTGLTTGQSNNNTTLATLAQQQATLENQVNLLEREEAAAWFNDATTPSTTYINRTDFFDAGKFKNFISIAGEIMNPLQLEFGAKMTQLGNLSGGPDIAKILVEYETNNSGNWNGWFFPIAELFFTLEQNEVEHFSRTLIVSPNSLSSPLTVDPIEITGIRIRIAVDGAGDAVSFESAHIKLSQISKL